MPTHRRTVAAAVAGACIAVAAAAAIVAVRDRGSTPHPSAEAARPSAEVLPAVWHERPGPVPAFAWTDADGAPVALADFAGTPVLLNLWASWCAPCIREMPLLDALAGETRDALAVVVLNQDRDAEAARRFWAERGFQNLALYLDPGLAAFKALSVRGLPLTLVVDAAGREVARLEGIAEWTAPEIVGWLRAFAAAGRSGGDERAGR